MGLDDQSRGADRRRRVSAWMVPVVVTGALTGVGLFVATNASSASPRLPARSAQTLLTKVQTTADTALSGEVAETASLGLPDLPGAGSAASLSWQTFLTGTHKVRVWVDGASRQRAALIGQLSEADVVHNGRDVWTYTSSSNAVSHTVLPANSADKPTPGADVHNPATVAQQLLKAIDPSTRVAVDRNRYVAGRASYTLVLTPRSADSTVRKVTVAIDARTFVPLDISVYGSGNSPALELGFTKVSFARPSASVFKFRAPAGASTTKDPFGLTTSGEPGRHADGSHRQPGASSPRPTASAPTVIGTAWTIVVELHRSTGIPGLGGRSLQELTTAVGQSGERLLRTKLINALFLPDGRAFLGAVTPAALERVAAATPH